MLGAPTPADPLQSINCTLPQFIWIHVQNTAPKCNFTAQIQMGISLANVFICKL